MIKKKKDTCHYSSWNVKPSIQPGTELSVSPLGEERSTWPPGMLCFCFGVYTGFISEDDRMCRLKYFDYKGVALSSQDQR